MSDAWKKIETAPMDTWISVYGDPWEGGPRYGVARCKMVIQERWERISKTQQELRSEERLDWEGFWGTATHWKPLDPSPAA